MSFWVLNANYEVTTSAFTEVTEEMKIKVSRQKLKPFDLMKCAINISAACGDHLITNQQWLKETVRGRICDLRRFKEQRTVMAKSKFPQDDIWLMQQVLPILKAQRTFPPTSSKVLKHMPIILMTSHFTSLPLTLSHFLTYKYFTLYVIKSIDSSSTVLMLKIFLNPVYF